MKDPISKLKLNKFFKKTLLGLPINEKYCERLY